MTRVTTGSRLHFGLMNAGNVPGMPRFGGLGLMIETPAIVVSIECAAGWEAIGPNAERALDTARKITKAYPNRGRDRERFRITVEECPPLHVGLGVGTQLALAISQAVSLQLSQEYTPQELAPRVGRGKRSAIGVEGFDSGGFILDHGKDEGETLGDTQRHEWPDDWKIVLARPHTTAPWHGDSEVEAFARSRPHDGIRLSEYLRSMAVEAVIPALNDLDFELFGEALYEYNRAAGEAFAEDQGGIYSSSEVESLIAWIRTRGINGVGQSSWGPTVFAVCRDSLEANRIASELTMAFPNLEHVSVTNASNTGFRYEKSN